MLRIVKGVNYLVEWTVSDPFWKALFAMNQPVDDPRHHGWLGCLITIRWLKVAIEHSRQLKVCIFVLLGKSSIPDLW